MPRSAPVPLAWKNLAHDKVRFALFASGIGFAVVLMGVQYGIMNAMLDSNTVLIEKLKGDLVLINPNKASLLFREGVSRRRIAEAEGTAGVKSVSPVFVEYSIAALRHTAADPSARTSTRRVRVIGVDPNADVLDLPGVSAKSWQELNTPGTALYDRKSRPHPDQVNHPGESVFGKLEPGAGTELAGRDIRLVAGFEMGFDFGTDGSVVVSDRTFEKWVREPYYPTNPMADADIGVVKLVPGADVGAVKKALQAKFAAGGDVLVLTRDEMVSREKNFWWANTPIGFAFGAGVLLGFVVGMVICYQILASDVADHLPEYATLKAIGYTNRYLSWVVVQESLILAAAGFVPGILVTYGTYLALTDITGLPMLLTPARFALVLLLTVVMCVASGLLAVSKVKKVDPADVF
ncbi:abc transporter : DevC protein OS=Singulisphaera acidiphila (strain ATCC BAA-1392 / DSM 18658 / VKM B-2454 / MOB10) GN=Sinac_4919 PE=4 SV=1: MacB_PCD: FtsX [Gemmata massiliana]|uniref:ABC3 transporter permease C-terminal domain-containing protein n=1 Tax=Gemmata massiliana TaxID=1210884 RepID=A0A6P2DEY5_9BACT|nr:ABC transporter permease DevC [Gemmata massiliana]VTS00241.1 abc transporter : DevC protein OS=Singulisphaera acidiphila (strain ATCC BAA-1392 / DSM 18658 / VKM B-2454 / MOB10) GN=Sinac_4919 PE=4 SV=1: MacB_PCD: FtsX [Gemmata massiliana]